MGFSPPQNQELVLAKAAAFVARQGRPLELARLGLFGGPTSVLAVLASYQNPDGGFGHGLEPDFWNPESSPIQSWVAVEVLREIGWTDAAHPLVVRLLAWLEEQFAAVTGLPSVIPGNNAHPHAPWWNYQEAGAHSNHSEWNPQAALAGFAWARTVSPGRLEALSREALVRATAAFAADWSTFDPHVVACFVTLADEVGGGRTTGPV